MLRTMRALAGLGASRTLLKTALRGGVLRLTASELSYGEGVLGSRNVQRFPLAEVERVEVDAPLAGRGVDLTIEIAGRAPLRLAGVNPTAARRLRGLLATLRRAGR